MTSADVMAILTPIWNEKRETAGRVKQRIGAIMDWAVAQNLRTDNPVTAVAAALPKNGVKVQHHAALPWADVPAALSKVRSSTSRLAARLCFEFLILTALRSGEARQLRWEWFDLDSRLAHDSGGVYEGRARASGTPIAASGRHRHSGIERSSSTARG